APCDAAEPDCCASGNCRRRRHAPARETSPVYRHRCGWLSGSCLVGAGRLHPASRFEGHTRSSSVTLIPTAFLACCLAGGNESNLVVPLRVTPRPKFASESRSLQSRTVLPVLRRFAFAFRSSHSGYAHSVGISCTRRSIATLRTTPVKSKSTSRRS